MYAEFMGGCTYLRVRSFFGDFWVFSVPFREQLGQPHHGRAHPGPLRGYRLLLEWVFFRLMLIFIEPSVLLYILQGRRPPVWNFTLPLCSKRNCTHHKVVCIGGRARVSHQPGFFFSTVCFLVSESKARDPLLCSTKGEGGVYGGQSVSRFP